MFGSKTLTFFFSVALLLFHSSSFANDEAQYIQLKQAKVVISQSKTPPDFTHANTIPLPHKWTHDSHEFYGSVWYQLTFDSNRHIKKQWAVYLQEVNMNAELWLNDINLGSGGSMEAPLSRFWHSPLLFVFSPSDLKDNNVLTIRVVSYANEFGLLGDVVLGEKNLIDPLYNSKIFNTVSIHIISGSLAAVYALFMIIVWWKRRDSVFFWGALICMFWSISSLNYYIIDPILDVLVWEKLMHLSVGSLPLFFFFFIRRLNAIHFTRKFEGNILLGAVILAIPVIFSSQSMFFNMSRIFQAYTMFWGLFSVVTIFYLLFKYRKPIQLSMVIAFALIAISGVHDILIQLHIIEIGNSYWLNYSVPIILLLIGYLVISRFLIAVDASEKLNKELENRVEKAQLKIESNYKEILALEVSQASNNERERIYRDLHDDMGAKLLSLVYKSENNETSSLARSAMNDLRAIVSKKPSQKHLLIELIDDWKITTQKRCNDSHIKLNWHQKHLPKHLLLSLTLYQNLLRIQTEAISNIIKHSSGNAVAVSVQYRMNCLRIKIQDNGDFSNLESWEIGRGISNMKFRIKQMNGKIRWHDAKDRGGYVLWIIPIHKT